jgi:hypothetical protein
VLNQLFEQLGREAGGALAAHAAPGAGAPAAARKRSWLQRLLALIGAHGENK